MLPHQHGFGNTSNSSQHQDLFRSRPIVTSVNIGVENENSSSNHTYNNNNRPLERGGYPNHMTDIRGGNPINIRLPFGSSSSSSTSNPAPNYWKFTKNKKNSDCEEPDDTKALLEKHPILDESYEDGLKQIERVSFNILFGCSN